MKNTAHLKCPVAVKGMVMALCTREILRTLKMEREMRKQKRNLFRIATKIAVK